MKKSILLLSLSLIAAQVFAQITIERSDYTLTTDGATVLNWYLTTDGVSLPEEGTDVVWDFSGQAITGSFSYTKTPVSEPLFPSANLVEMTTGTALNLVPQGVNFYEELADDGYKTLGRATQALSVPAQTITGGPNDTISFLGNTSVYDEPVYNLKFPLNYEDSWDTEINIWGNYQMTVAVFGLDHTPASSKYNYVENNTVLGAGTLILPHPDGTGTVSIEALLLKSTSIRTDSFYLAGQPAPQLMLDALGLIQGNKDTIANYSFYAKGLKRSALIMGEINGQITGMNMADDIRNVVSSIHGPVDFLTDVKVFPNPTSGDFQINFEKPDAKIWSLDVYNSLGQLVKQTLIDAPSGNIAKEVSLSNSAHSGLYQYVLRNTDRVVRAAGKVLVK